MTKITYQATSPKGTATLDTSRLVIGTDGCTYMRSTADGRLVSLGPEQEGVLARHFGSPVWRSAIEAVGELA